MNRPSFEQSMMDIAQVIAQRSTCQKRKVGCVLTDWHDRILSCAFNGAPSGMPHCVDEPCLAAGDLTRSVSCPAIHAEMNALMWCADIKLVKRIFVTTLPCQKCALLVLNSGARELHFIESHMYEEDVMVLFNQRIKVYKHEVNV